MKSSVRSTRRVAGGSGFVVYRSTSPIIMANLAGDFNVGGGLTLEHLRPTPQAA